MPTIKNETAWDGKAIRSILIRLENLYPFTQYPLKWQIHYKTGRYSGFWVRRKDSTAILGLPRSDVDPIILAVRAHNTAHRGRSTGEIRENAALFRKFGWAAQFPITKRAPRPSDAPVAKQTRVVKTINSQIKSWTRKQKLAGTKLKKLRTKLKRAEKRLAELEAG